MNVDPTSSSQQNRLIQCQGEFLSMLNAETLTIFALFILVFSTGHAAESQQPIRPISIWTSTVSIQPTALYFSRSEKLVHVFGENPKRISSLNPEDGSIVQENVLSNSTVLGIIRSVVIHEDKDRVALALLWIEGASRTNDTNTSRLLCWDFASKMVLWEFDLASSGLSPPLVGNPAWTDDGKVLFQHFAGGEVYAFHARTGEVVWIQYYFPTAGWTYLNDSLYGGILTEVGGSDVSPGIYQIDAITGDFVSRYLAPNLCFEQGSTFLAPNAKMTRQDLSGSNCNNIWSNSVPSKSKEFLYVIDDLFGLMKFSATNIQAGPLWTNAFAQDNDDKKSQKAYFSPLVSSDDRVVYASAYWTTVAINALDGTTIWSISQDEGWLTRDLVISPNGDALFLSYNSSIHKVDASSGVVEFATDPNLFNTLMVYNDEASVFFTTGEYHVHAYETNIVAPGNLVEHGMTGTHSGTMTTTLIFAVMTTAIISFS